MMQSQGRWMSKYASLLEPVVNIVGMNCCETHAAVSCDMVLCAEQVMIDTSLSSCVGN